jgi:Mg2+ and Co2+ transporter CorA
MNKSSEMLKEACIKKGIDWNSTYAGALGRLLDVFDSEIADAMLTKANEKLDEMLAKLNGCEGDITNARRKLESEQYQLNVLVTKAEKATEALRTLSETKLSDAKNVETVNLYKLLLKSGKDVFGEERMTDSAIASLCNAASYIVWRDIMGPKGEEQKWNGKRY